MKRKSKFKLVVVIILVIAGYLAYEYYSQSSVIEVVNTPATPEQVESAMEKSIKAIQEREEFKKQQEVRAKEIYLTEEKARIQAEYDEKLTKIEAQLEEVRAEKVSFQ